jgi:hypothetical protein
VGDEGLCSLGVRLSRRRPAQHHIDRPAPRSGNRQASYADQDPPSRRHVAGPSRQDRARTGARSPWHQTDQPQLSFRRIAERRRRAGLGFHRRKPVNASGELRAILSQAVAPVAGSSCALQHVDDGFSRCAISSCGLNENAPVWLCLPQQPSSQPPTHRQARSPMAKRRRGSRSQPAPTERQGGLLAKNSGSFCSPSSRVIHLCRENS